MTPPTLVEQIRKATVACTEDMAGLSRNEAAFGQAAHQLGVAEMRKAAFEIASAGDKRIAELESALSQCLNGLRIIADIDPDPDRCAADYQIARLWIQRAGFSSML